MACYPQLLVIISSIWIFFAFCCYSKLRWILLHYQMIDCNNYEIYYLQLFNLTTFNITVIIITDRLEFVSLNVCIAILYLGTGFDSVILLFAVLYCLYLKHINWLKSIFMHKRIQYKYICICIIYFKFFSLFLNIRWKYVSENSYRIVIE